MTDTDSTRLHNRETTGQFLTVPLHKVDDLFGDLQSNRRRISEKNHTLRVFPKGKHKLAEVFIFRNNDSLLLRGKMEDLGVFRPGGNFRDGYDVMARAAERTNHGKVAAFIGQKAQDSFPC